MEGTVERRRVFISTLGLRPQVVTLALDILHRQRHEFDEICVVHTDDTPDPVSEARGYRTMHGAVKQLDNEFFLSSRPQSAPQGEARWIAEYRHAPVRRPVVYRRVKIMRQAEPHERTESGWVGVKDVETRANSRATFAAIYRLVREYKEERATIHFSIAGGRKSMSVFAMAAAQLLFEHGDALWHLVSETEFENRDGMHDEQGHSRLVPIRFVYLSAIAPAVSQLIIRPDPFDAIAAQEEFLHPIDLSRKERFLSGIDVKDRQILAGLARGLTNAEIGARMEPPRAGATVANRLTEIYESYLIELGVPRTKVEEPARERIRTFLAAEFGAYLQYRGERLDELRAE